MKGSLYFSIMVNTVHSLAKRVNGGDGLQHVKSFLKTLNESAFLSGVLYLEREGVIQLKTCFIFQEKRNILFANRPPCVLALGFFDGVHKGHQKVIKTAVEKAKKKGLKAAVMTFSPHPKEVITNGKKQVAKLTTFVRKEQLIRELGVHFLYVIHFDNQFASLRPQQFINKYLIPLQVKHVVAGFDFTYGAKEMGNMKRLDTDSRGAFTVTTVDKVDNDGEKISSTLIRKKVMSGDFTHMLTYLGRFYETCGVVKFANRNAILLFSQEVLLPQTDFYEVLISSKKSIFKTVVHCEADEKIIHLPSLNPLMDSQKVKVQWLRRCKQSLVKKGKHFSYST